MDASLHSISGANSEQDEMKLLADDDDKEKTNQGVFVLREKKGVIYPLDYKYRVGKFDQFSFNHFRLQRTKTLGWMARFL